MPAVGQPQKSNAARGDVRSVLTLIFAVLILAAVYLSWRIPAGENGDKGVGGALLLGTGLIAALTAVQNARLFSPRTAGWLLIGSGSIVWSLAHFLRSTTEPTAVLIYTGLFLLSAISLITGCLRIAGIAPTRKTWRQFTIDLMPPITALLTAAWLVEIGPFVRSGDVETHFRIAAALHGLAAVALIVVGVVGVFSWRQLRTNPAIQSVMAGLAIVAVADGLWLQRWIDRDASFGGQVCET